MGPGDHSNSASTSRSSRSLPNRESQVRKAEAGRPTTKTQWCKQGSDRRGQEDAAAVTGMRGIFYRAWLGPERLHHLLAPPENSDRLIIRKVDNAWAGEGKARQGKARAGPAWPPVGANR